MQQLGSGTIQSTVDYFPSKAVAEEAVGTLFGMSPIVYAAKRMKLRKTVNGLGQTEVRFENLDSVQIGVIFALAILVGALSYQAGKAMAPNSKAETRWGWTGVPMGMVFGTWGLGVMGAISNMKK